MRNRARKKVYEIYSTQYDCALRSYTLPRACKYRSGSSPGKRAEHAAIYPADLSKLARRPGRICANAGNATGTHGSPKSG